MNWKRGLLRLWIAVSLLWLIHPTYVLINQLRDLAATEGSTIPYPADYWPQSRADAFLQFVATAIGPPISLLVLGLAATWIIAGFRQPTK
jgi:hypothetical protein